MRFLRDLSIRQRLLGSTVLLCLLIIGLGAWSALSMDHLQTRSSDLLDRQSQTAQDTARILASLERVQRLEQSVMLNGTTRTKPVITTTSGRKPSRTCAASSRR